MTLKVTKKQQSFTGVPAGGVAGTAQCVLTLGLSVEQIAFTYSGVTLAQMTGIRILANGKEVMNFRSGTELDAFNTYSGRAAAAGILVVDFCRYGMRTRMAEEMTKFGTGFPYNGDKKSPLFNPVEVTLLTMEIDISAAAAGAVLVAYALSSDPAPTGVIQKVKRFQPAFNAGETQIDNLPRGDIMNTVFANAADITALRVERDGYTVFDRPDALNDLFQNDGVRVASAAYFVYDPTENGNGSEGLVTSNVGDLRFIYTKTGAAAVPMTVFYIGYLGA